METSHCILTTIYYIAFGCFLDSALTFTCKASKTNFFVNIWLFIINGYPIKMVSILWNFRNGVIRWQRLPKFDRFVISIFSNNDGPPRTVICRINSTTVIAKIKGMPQSLRYSMLRHNGLWEVIHIFPFDTMGRNPCMWSSKSCHLHVDVTFQLWCLLFISY